MGKTEDLKVLKKVISRLNGDFKLENATAEKRDSEEFVLKCVVNNGADELKNASARLKSDAKFVLNLVKIYPECLNECADVMFDRYELNGEKVENPVDRKLFATMCCEQNVEAFRCLKHHDALQYLHDVEEGRSVKGMFQGKSVEIQLENDEDYIDLLKYVRFGYFKTGSLYASSRTKEY